MKKTIIISALALSFAFVNVNANTLAENTNNILIETVKPEFKVNSFCTSIAKGDIETVKKLIALGEDVNAKSNGMSPAMYAAKYNRTEVLELLVNNGAKLNSRCKKGLTALQHAQKSNAKDCIAYIKAQKKSKK